MSKLKPLSFPNYISVPDEIFTERLVKKMSREDLILLMIICKACIDHGYEECLLDLDIFEAVSGLTKEQVKSSAEKLRELDIIDFKWGKEPQFKLRFKEE